MRPEAVWWGRRWCVVTEQELVVTMKDSLDQRLFLFWLLRRRRTVELAHLEVGPELLELVDPLPDEGVVADDDRPALPSRGEGERRADRRLAHAHLPSRRRGEGASQEVRVCEGVQGDASGAAALVRVCEGVQEGACGAAAFTSSTSHPPRTLVPSTSPLLCMSGCFPKCVCRPLSAASCERSTLIMKARLCLWYGRSVMPVAKPLGSSCSSG